MLSTLLTTPLSDHGGTGTAATAWQTTDGPAHPSPEVVAAVDRQLRELSAAAPSLPWRTGSGSGGGGKGARKAGGARRR